MFDVLVLSIVVVGGFAVGFAVFALADLLAGGVTIRLRPDSGTVWARCANCADPIPDPHEGLWSCGFCGATLCCEMCRAKHGLRCERRTRR